MSHLFEFTRKQLQTLQKSAVILLVVHIVLEGWPNFKNVVNLNDKKFQSAEYLVELPLMLDWATEDLIEFNVQ